jgi:hypothetical protein
MDELHYKADELPVLTEVARPESLNLATPVNAVIDLRVGETEPDKGGYDPYNKAPPKPGDDADTA